MAAKNEKSVGVLCWICKENEANSGEHMTKRSDLAAALGSPTQAKPFYFNGLKRQNKPIMSLDAKILKAPVRICHECNTTRTQPHDRAWEHMSDQLRNRPLVLDRWLRANKVFPYDTRQRMIDVQLYFLKLFGCMVSESKSNGHNVPIEIAPFSKAIMGGRPHPEVHLQFGKCDGVIGRSHLHCWTTNHDGVLAGWLYELDRIAVSVIFARAGHWEHRRDLWHPVSPSNSRRFLIADFMYANRAAAESEDDARG